MIGAPDALDGADSMPHAAPLHPAPESAQVTPLLAGSFVTVALTWSIPPACTLAAVSETVTLIAGGAAVTVIVTEADFVVSATEVAVSITVAGVGTLAGAIYVMDPPDALDVADNVPHAAPLHPAPESDHITPLLAESLVTVAITDCDWPTCTDIVVGVTLTEIAAGAGGGDEVWPLPPPLLTVVPAQPAVNNTVTMTATAGISRCASPRVTSRVSRLAITGLLGRKFLRRDRRRPHVFGFQDTLTPKVP